LAERLARQDFLADTVHKFQGDERDVMIFSPVLSRGITPGAISFLRNNGNLFNVAITRARAMLIVVGDLDSCSNSEVEYIAEFAKYTQTLRETEAGQATVEDLGPEYPAVANPEQVSDWEKILYAALYRKGIRTMAQFAVEKYLLDLVLVDQGRRLNIEVDGERYHRAWNGELCRRDQMRNQRLYELGWDVMRFWVYEIRDDLSGCVKKVDNWVNKNARHS
jgi:very-short-patch-repair endonuclease